MEFHPIAEVWPLFDADALEALAADIKRNGLEQPVVTYQSKILDGRNRYLACRKAGVEPRYVEYKGDDPIGKALSLNEQRRHLDASQRALVAARLTNLPQHRPVESSRNRLLSQGEAAAKMNVGVTSVKEASKVQEFGSPALVEAVEAGKIAVSTAAALTNLTPLEQAEVVKLVDKAEIIQRAKEAQEARRRAGTGRGSGTPRAAAPAPWVTLQAWKAAATAARLRMLQPPADQAKPFNKQDSDLIDWAQWSWNPVTGCLHECPYCYARDIAQRFYEHGFEPTLHPGRLLAPSRMTVPDKAADDIRYRNVFTCSMADLFGRWVPVEWIEAVLKAARDASQWNFLFLTKFPKRMAEFSIPRNAWMGTTVDCQARVASAEKAFVDLPCDVRWLSVEPMIEPLKFSRLELFDWIVIGGASRSSQTPEFHPRLEWVTDLEEQARDAGCRVYRKPNLFAPIREMPWDEPQPQPLEAPEIFRYLSRTDA